MPYFVARMIPRNPEAGYQRGTYVSPRGYQYQAGSAWPNRPFVPSNIYPVDKAEAEHLQTVRQPKFKHLPVFEVLELPTEDAVRDLVQQDAEDMHKRGQPFVRAQVLPAPQTNSGAKEMANPSSSVAALEELGTQNARLRTELGAAQNAAQRADEENSRLRGDMQRMQDRLARLERRDTTAGVRHDGGSPASLLDDGDPNLPPVGEEPVGPPSPHPEAGGEQCPACSKEVTHYDAADGGRKPRRHKTPAGEWCTGDLEK